MTPTLGLISYLVVWWLFFFALEMKRRRTIMILKSTSSTEPNPKISLSLIKATFYALLVWGAMYGLVISGAVGFHRA